LGFDPSHVDLAIAFARASGFYMIKDALEAHLSKKGNTARFIFGLDYCQTDPQVLRSILAFKKKFMKRVEAYVYESQDGSCFHPKIYRFKYADKVKVCAGSANLTGGGLRANREFSIIYEEKIDGRSKEYIDSITDDDFAEQLTSERLERYIPKYQRAKASKAIISHVNKQASQSKLYQFQIRLAQMKEDGTFQDEMNNRSKP
jgi:HKD family nuclease